MKAEEIDTIRFNENDLLKYLIDFDYIVEKYGIQKDTDEYVSCAEIECRDQSADVVKRDYSYIYNNIRLVYGDDEKAQRMMYIYKIVKEEFINKFLNIPGLERMYDEHFFEFEWDMHSRLDFDKHNISFYRDHFVHQVRNLYEMYKLLEHDKANIEENKKIHFMEDLERHFDYGDNKLSAYIKRAVDKMVAEQKDSIFKRAGRTDEECRRDYIRYIIKASVAMSALFHDIGYPVLHFEGLRKRIAGFMPSLYMFMGGEGNNFEWIYAQLCNSFLFRAVGKEELRKAVCCGENHGAVSAVAFLLAFYQNGIINSIPQEKKLAIEIAAVAIYNHTLKYRCVDGDEADGYYRPVYTINPVSYLLRVCDDMQEWERTYFEIRNIPELMVCEKCGNTFMRQREKHFKGFLPPMYKYKCSCGKMVSINSSDDYVRRKIIDIINCKEVRMSFYKVDDSIVRKFICIHFDYDLALLLRMCVVSATFCKYRVKELNKLKRILVMQKFGGFNETMVDFLLTPNPFILKAAILGKISDTGDDMVDEAYSKTKALSTYTDISAIRNRIRHLRIIKGSLNRTDCNIGIDNNNENDWEIKWKEAVNNIDSLKKDFESFIRSLYKLRNGSQLVKDRQNGLCFYLLLHKVSELFKHINSCSYELKDKKYIDIDMDKLKKFIKNKLMEYAKKICSEKTIIRDSEIFIDDAVEQYSKLFDNRAITSERMNYKNYYDEFKTSDKVYDVVQHYCYSGNIANRKMNTLNFYSDFDLFVKSYNDCRMVEHIIDYSDNGESIMVDF